MSTQHADRPSRLEPIVTVILFGAVFGSLAITLLRGEEYVESSSEFGRLPGIVDEVFSSVERDLACGKVLAFGGEDGVPPFITYVLPVDVGEDDNGDGVLGTKEDDNGDGKLEHGDGDVHDRDGNMQWGYRARGRSWLDQPTRPQRLTLSFERTDTVSEKELNVDVNKDGDLIDDFDRGYLVRVSNKGETERLGGGLVVVPSVREASKRFISKRGSLAWECELTFVARDHEGRAHALRVMRTIESLNRGL